MDEKTIEPINKFETERIYDVSPQTMWRAWTEPEMLKLWWGPENVTIPKCEVDLRVGGRFYIVMEAGEAMGPYKGAKWPMLAEYTAVVPNLRLSYKAQAWTEGQKEETMIEQTTEITLTEENSPPSSRQGGTTGGQSKTKLKVKAVILKTGPGLGALQAVQGMQGGFTQQLEKLNNFLASKK